MSLGSRTAAPNSAGADSNFRLLYVVASSQRVCVWFTETRQALLLIVLHVMPCNWGCQGSKHHDIQVLLPTNAAQKEANYHYRYVCQRCAEIGLFKDQEHGNAYDCASLDEVRPGEFPVLYISKVLGNSENQNQLNPFGWLKVIAAWQLHPASRSQIFLSEHQHCH